MQYAQRKLIGFGILILLAGVLLHVVGSQLAILLFGAMPNSQLIGGAIISYVLLALQFGAAPLGAMMIALGIAFRLIEKASS